MDIGNSQRKKGKRGELELAHILSEYGFDCRRGQQYCGIDGEDVVGLPFVHIEVKRVEKLNIWDAMEQAKHNAKEGLLPVVFHRRNRSEWLVTMRLGDWIALYQAWENNK